MLSLFANSYFGLFVIPLLMRHAFEKIPPKPKNLPSKFAALKYYRDIVHGTLAPPFSRTQICACICALQNSPEVGRPLQSPLHRRWAVGDDQRRGGTIGGEVYGRIERVIRLAVVAVAMTSVTSVVGGAAEALNFIPYACVWVYPCTIAYMCVSL